MSSSSSSSSTSSSSSSEDGNGGGVGGQYGAPRRGGDFEGPSSSRRRAVNEVWPEPFLEALATQVAIDAARSVGRLAAAAALANVFQVCSTWRAVSRSDLLWHRLTRLIWRRTHLIHATWRHEYVYRHRTANNFRAGRCNDFPLHFDPSDVDSPEGLTCRCLALSDLHLACGFADGAVRLFDVATRLHVATFRPDHHRDRLGQFSRAVAGIVISNNSSRLVFATLDGDVHVVDNIHINPAAAAPQLVHPGDLVDDGVLVDFAGCSQYWVGLFAGLPNRAFHIWNSQTATVTFDGGSLMNQNSLIGWRMLTELTELVGRVRVSEGHDVAVACTRERAMVFDLRNQVVLNEEENVAGIVVGSVDVSREAYVMVDARGWATVRRVDTLEEVCRFNTRVRGGGVMGCMNLMYVLMCAGGMIRVWGVEGGNYLYRLRPRVTGEINAFVADDRHVAASSGSMIHLWDFGAEEDENDEDEDED